MSKTEKLQEGRIEILTQDTGAKRGSKRRLYAPGYSRIISNTPDPTAISSRTTLATDSAQIGSTYCGSLEVLVWYTARILASGLATEMSTQKKRKE